MKRLKAWLLSPLHVLALATSAKSFRDNPVLGHPDLNRRGLHLLRRRIAERLGTMRRAGLTGLISPADRAAFERDGFVLRPNFLDEDTYRAFRAEILGMQTTAREAVIGDTLTRLIPLDAVTMRDLPVVRSVLEGPTYRGLLAYVGSFKRKPNLYVQTVFSRHCEGEPDVQSFFHYDTFHPTVKAWFYLDDVEDDGTPLAFVPGSHKVNARRLAWERRVSMTAGQHDDKLTAEGSLRISEAEIKRLGYPPPRRLAVPANTLVVADTSGIHARSPTNRSAVRVSIWAYSRSNPFLPFAGDPASMLPTGRALRLYWFFADRFKDARKVQRDWRWVGIRSPLSPPTLSDG